MPTMNIHLTTIVQQSGLVLVTVVSLLLAVDAVANHKTTTGDAPPQASDTMQGEMMIPGAQGLMMPQMDPARGRELFASKGCVTCHSINGVGGEDATPLDAHTMQSMMNPFEFAAKMWRMAPAMIAAQEEALGEQIEFTGDELADIIAFVHHDAEQHHFSESDIPPEIMPMMHHMHGGEGGAAAHAEELGHMHEAGEEHND
jgi:cytochrome c